MRKLKLKYRKYIKKIDTEYGKIEGEKELDKLLRGGDNYTKLAVIKLAIERNLGMTPYDEQLICAIKLIGGYAVEMHTGEGKSLASLIASIYIGLDRKIYNVTVNEYLAKRDYKKFKSIYDELGIKVSFNPDKVENNDDQLTEEDKNEILSADVIYTSSSAIMFDYLQSVIDKEEFIMESAILDEVDFILLDNANSSFSISMGDGEEDSFDTGVLLQLNSVFRGLKGAEISYKVLQLDYEYLDSTEYDYVYVNTTKEAVLTRMGEQKILDSIGIDSMLDNLYVMKNVYNLLHVYCFQRRGVDYIVEDGKVKLINVANGRVQENSKLGEGLHSALEAKEGVEITTISSDSVKSSYQVFFSKFEHLCGMSGTIMSDTGEFETLYGMNTVRVPLHRKNRCKTNIPKYYKTSEEKITGMIKLVEERHSIGQPILIICGNEGETGRISKLLEGINIEHNLLNNQYLNEEDGLIKEAGKKGIVTVSSNLAGRGTDIVITEESEELGGLYVIALTNYSSVRIENQIKGRAGRQGFKGEFQLLSSIDDAIWSKLYLKEYNKIVETPDNKFYSKRYQNKLHKTIKWLQELYSISYTNTRKYLYYYNHVIEDIKIYVVNRYANMGTEKFIESVMGYKIKETGYIGVIEEGFSITLLDNEGEYTQEKYNVMCSRYIAKVIISRLKYTPEKYKCLIHTLYDRYVMNSWGDLQEQLLEYASIVTRNSYSNKEMSEFVTGSREIVDKFVSDICIDVIDNVLTVQNIEIRGK